MIKTYYSILYFQTTFKDRINVGLVMFDGKHCIAKLNDSRMDKIKLFSNGYKLFKMTTESIVFHFNNITAPNKTSINRLHFNSNNMFGIDKASFIDVDFNQEEFDKLFNIIFK